jgi:ketosteroid isomerase-like protein
MLLHFNRTYPLINFKEEKMSLYEKMKAASDNRDVEAWLDCIHDDFVFVRHQTGAEMSKEEWTPMVTAMMQSDQLEIKNQRCIYENEEILVTHSMMNFPDGTSEAVMVVNKLKDGKVIRVETGATPIESA